MHYSPRATFSSDENEPEDDVDELFKQLKPLKPPPELIARILSSVAELSRSIKAWSEDELDGLVIRNEKKEPS